MNKKSSGISRWFALILLAPVIFLAVGVLTVDSLAQQITVNPSASSTLTVSTITTTYPKTYPITITGTGGSFVPITKRVTYWLPVWDATAPVMTCADSKYFSVTPTSASDSEQISVYAAATDNVGISSIDIRVDGAVTTCTAPADKTQFSCPMLMGPYSAGSSHTIEARAYDAAGNANGAWCSSTVTVTNRPADCDAAINTAPHGNECDVGDIAQRINCGCVGFICG